MNERPEDDVEAIRQIRQVLLRISAEGDQNVRAAVEYFRQFGIAGGLKRIGVLVNVDESEPLEGDRRDTIFRLARIGASVVLTSFMTAAAEEEDG